MAIEKAGSKQLQPESVDGYMNLAAAYAAAGRFEHAVNTLDAALRLSPDESLVVEIRRRRDAYAHQRNP